MSLVPETLYESRRVYEFERTGSVHKTLNIGMAQRIRNFIEKDTPYEIMEEGKWGWKYKTPLWVCTKYGKTDFVRHLLQNGESPVAQESAALRWACGLGLREIAAMLLDAGADPDAGGPGPGAETYRWARREGHYDIIDLLDRSKRGEIFFPEKEEVAHKVQNIVKQRMEEPEPVEEPEENKGWI